MFSDIGKKLMSLGQIIAWVAFVSCMVCFLIFLMDGNAICLVWLLSGFASFPAAWPLYGFGQLIDDVHAIRNQGTSSIVESDELPRL